MKPLAQMGLTKFEITVEIILEPENLDVINTDTQIDQKLAKSIAEALGLTGKFRVNPYQWDFSTEPRDSNIIKS